MRRSANNKDGNTLSNQTNKKEKGESFDIYSSVRFSFGVRLAIRVCVIRQGYRGSNLKLNKVLFHDM